MRWLVASVLALSFVASHKAVAQDDPNGDILKELYTRIVNSIDLRRGALEDVDGQYFFVVTQPGIFIDPALLNADGNENGAQKRIFSEIVDRVMLPSWVYGPTDETYHEYYSLILDSYEHAPLQLTDEQSTKLDEYRRLLYSDADMTVFSKVYDSYLQRQQAYLNALGNGEAYFNQNPGSGKLPLSVSTKIENAMTDWLAGGRKNEVENAREFIRRYDPAGFWSDARAQYNRTLEDASLHLYYPAISTWLDSENKWPSLTVSWSKSEGTTYSHQTTSSGGGSFSAFGFFEIGGGNNFDRIKKVEQNEATDLSVSFEYMRVDFRRPWLTRRVFSDKRWRFECGTDPAVKKWIVSSGPRPDGAEAVVYPHGLMPMIPTGFLIVRNASVTGNFSENFSDYYKRVITKSGSGGWGPFRVRGSYSDTVEETEIDSTTAANGFTVGHPQILGFFVEVLPASPDPLPGLFEDCEVQQ